MKSVLIPINMYSLGPYIDYLLIAYWLLCMDLLLYVRVCGQDEKHPRQCASSCVTASDDEIQHNITQPKANMGQEGINSKGPSNSKGDITNI